MARGMWGLICCYSQGSDGEGGKEEFKGNSFAICSAVFTLCQSHASCFHWLPED